MTKIPVELDLLSEEEVLSFLGSFDTVLTDCDGVLWKGNVPLPGSPEVITLLRQAGKKIIYVTNNGTRHRRDYVKKFHKLGFGGEFSDIFTPSYLCALYLHQQKFDKKVYLFGNKGVDSELDEVGISHIGSCSDYDDVTELPDVAASVHNHLKQHGSDVGAIIAAYWYNQYNINVTKLAIASSYAANPDVMFIGTNRDPSSTFKEEMTKIQNDQKSDVVLPMEGAFIKAIEIASGRDATVLGKPSKFMFQAIKQNHNIVPAKTIMIGDRCETDILFGKRNGVRTVMVGSGVHSLKQVLGWAKSDDTFKRNLVPDFYLPSLGRLMMHVKKLVK